MPVNGCKALSEASAFFGFRFRSGVETAFFSLEKPAEFHQQSHKSVVIFLHDDLFTESVELGFLFRIHDLAHKTFFF